MSGAAFLPCIPVTQPIRVNTTTENVSAVTDGPRDADLCTMKSYQLIQETQLLQTECAMVVMLSTDSCRRPSRLYAVCIALTVDSREAASQVSQIKLVVSVDIQVRQHIRLTHRGELF